MAGDDDVPLSIVLGTLTRSANVEERPVERVIASILETSAETLGIARVNAWLYDPDRRAIHCVDSYDLRTKQHGTEAALRSIDYPSYFEALEELRSVTTMYATHDVRTRELYEYLNEHGITAMLDVPIVQGGRVVGVVCHEHVGPARSFSATERAFAGSIGDLVALVLESDRRVRADAEQRRLSEQLARVRGIESLGLLAAGTAHDFRNLLMVILASADFLAGRLSAGPLAEAAGSIEEAARQATELCERLLTYSGRRSPARKKVDLASTAGEICELWRARLPAGVELVTELATRLPAVEGDSLELRQVVLNLVANACDACAERGGRVVVRVAEATRAPAPEALDFRSGSGPALVLEVADDGGGMDPTTRARMFDPFFTTKPEGHGFGLATVLGVVRGHAGAIEIQSAEGAGTTVTVFLPVAVR